MLMLLLLRLLLVIGADIVAAVILQRDRDGMMRVVRRGRGGIVHRGLRQGGE